jgi:ethanolamine utilization protein EutA
MTHAMKLVGLDFGTTTSSAVVAATSFTRSSGTGKLELGPINDCFQSEKVFTPFQDDRLDERRLQEYLDSWLHDVAPAEVLGGGALLTGLAAQTSNAAAIVSMVRERLANSLVATANDPCLESWLTFLASCGRLSREHPESRFINLDIGGGTTNLALGQNGQVLRTGCLFIGARHIEVVPGSYQITKLSRQAATLFESLGIRKQPGDSLDEPELTAILDFYVGLLEATLRGTAANFGAVGDEHTEVEFKLEQDRSDCVFTFSGGVGELIYRHVQGLPWPAQTEYGDLGIDLAQRIVRSEFLAKDLHQFSSAAGGRATVYGLLRHSMELSGATVFISHPETLPLSDVPILGTLREDTMDSDIDAALKLAAASSAGGCLSIALKNADASEVRPLATRLSQALRRTEYPPQHPLVLLMSDNLGKVMGHFISDWGNSPMNLYVIDEIPPRAAQYVRLGKLQQHVLPVSFYGLEVEGA